MPRGTRLDPGGDGRQPVGRAGDLPRHHPPPRLQAPWGGAGPEGRRLAEDLVAARAASSDAAFLRSLYEHLLGTGEAETALRIDSPSLENWLL